MTKPLCMSVYTVATTTSGVNGSGEVREIVLPSFEAFHETIQD